MTTPPWSERQRQSLRDLKALLSLRARREAEIAGVYKTQSQAFEQQYQDNKRRLEIHFSQQQTDILARSTQALNTLQHRFEQDRDGTNDEMNLRKESILEEYQGTKEQLKAEIDEARWTTNTVYEADRKVARDHLDDQQRSCRKLVDHLHAQLQEARTLGSKLEFIGDLPEADEPTPIRGADPWHTLQSRADHAELDLAAIKQLDTKQLWQGRRPWLIVAGLWLLLAIPCALLLIWNIILALILFVGISILVPLAGWIAIGQMRRRIRDRFTRHWLDLDQAARGNEALKKECIDSAQTAYRTKRDQSKARAETLMHDLSHRWNEKLQLLRATRDRNLAELTEESNVRLAQLENARLFDKKQLETTFGQQQTESQARYDQELASIRKQVIKQREEINHKHATDWAELLLLWTQGSQNFLACNRTITEEWKAAFPEWNAAYQPASAMPWGLSFGELQIEVQALPGGQPTDPQLPPLQLGSLAFPALLPFPEKASLLIKATDEGKAAGIAALEALLLRCWLALPPGKVRCTIIDPVGRGENFSAFMHLADHDENLIHGRIWTESSQIEQRLEDLTGHMENVLQKYLRNQFQTLAEYNAQAGEVAEPFRFLVVADFPVNFSDDAARRLLSLASAGARSGIYTFILCDTKQTFPQVIDQEELERACTCLVWRKGRFVWEDDDYREFPLTLALPPEPARCTELLSRAGAEAKRASKVEVPFEGLMPPLAQWWTRDSRNGIHVPLGRAGARALQELNLGEGTSQHALIAGKTGSGKSTLLHVLITQLGLYYSPNEVELYLIDFKKGVEFKSYASCKMPHAKVVAVESEREFGLSVLQRLDVELTRRGELFRTLGVTDLRSYRDLMPTASVSNGDTSHPVLPRIMFIVDEFQEFFVEDDKIAQESALLMDRMVRQGRAFGIHVILGSQTLGGAYSLARSTIDQMAVRIALQCSEADAHLILSRDNTEARLLSRPGEAIYNASHGLLEGNRLFQIVWLADSRRDELLRQLCELGEARHQGNIPIVFEGNSAADLARATPLLNLMQTPPTPSDPWQAWLGDAVAIKDPTSATFRRQSGANLLIIGQQEDVAFRMMTAGLVSLGARIDSAGELGLHIVLATAPDAAGEAILPTLSEAFPIQNVSPRDLPTLLAQIAAEVERRQQTPASTSIFLCLFGLQRLRDLRRPEDDFGYGRKGDEKPSPYRLFTTILKEGPPLGVHILVWCDTLTNLNRTLERQTLREFDLRVLLQMSAADSSTLIDSPLASKLGPQRAYYFTEEQGRVEKFRPFALPSVEWLKEIADKRPVRQAASS